MISLKITTTYRLLIETELKDEETPLIKAFKESSARGLLHLDLSTEVITEEPVFSYWKDFSRLYLSFFTANDNLEKRDLKNDPIVIPFPMEELSRLLINVPPMRGAEYIHQDSLTYLWIEIERTLQSDILASGLSIVDYFSIHYSRLNLLGRVCFHMAENKKSQETPFAFLATFARQLSEEGDVQHVPLIRALNENTSKEQRNTFLRLISPLHKASFNSPFMKELVDSGDVYHTLAWTPQEAYQFLKDIPHFEKAGIAVRVPNWWKPKNPLRPQVSIKVGEKKPSHVGLDALLDFSVSLAIGEEELTQTEIQRLLASSENLQFFKGNWIEVDRQKLGDLLAKWKTATKAAKEGISFGEAMRLLSGVEGPSISEAIVTDHHYQRIISGQWLSTTISEITHPTTDRKLDNILKTHLKAKLRPYQLQGVGWLYRLNKLRLGGILADDMGLGKTIQVISLLLLHSASSKISSQSLLVVPASLIGNWKSELLKFAPSLAFWIAHSSCDGLHAPKEKNINVVITTYASIGKITWITEADWDVVIADEAQMIKNPGAKQTKALKLIKSKHRLALTGTPVENHLSDLWSLFDFVTPGLLGSPKEFQSFIKNKTKGDKNPYGSIKQLVSPYILRRLKTDKKVIADLPAKTELKSYCQITKAQALLYQKTVDNLAFEISHTDGIKRKGIILSHLMRFKQICNHPSQLVKDGVFLEADSGKFQRLREICEVIKEKQEKVLIFTQFKEMTGPLNLFLKVIFGHSGLVLHGETAINKRSRMVEEFQLEDGPPYFVLSLKAGGTGLNLTAASHVIHFDRWWNPAVEEQATDRAFRIGQIKNVMVHKFICQGTLEERIDSLIDSKKSISHELLGEGDANIFTELSNEDLLKIVSLDIKSALNQA